MPAAKPAAEMSEVKARILAAAADLFMEQGFAGTTVREIGERAGVGQSSLYHHARSKGQLLSELHGTFAEELIGLIEAIVASGSTPREQLRAVVKAILSVVHSHRAVVTIYLREGHALSNEARDAVVVQRDKMDAMLDGIIIRGMETGDFRSDLDVHLTRLALLGMCNWAYQWYRPDGKQKIGDIGEHFADLAEASVMNVPLGSSLRP